jgi:hypothetical protein
MDMSRMLQCLLGILVALAALLSPSARADEEGRVTLTHVQFDSKGLDNSGPIHVEATQSDQGVTQLSVSAFGKTQVLAPAQIAEMGRNSFNDIGLTYSRGYPESGGRNVVLLFCQGFSSGVKIVAVVTVTETRGIRVRTTKGTEQ